MDQPAEGEANLSATAAQFGFASQSLFCAAVRRQFGIAPGPLRRELRKDLTASLGR